VRSSATARRLCWWGTRDHPGSSYLLQSARKSGVGSPRGLTNEVQRRAKRVRCNAGLGRATVTVDCRACSCPIDRDPTPQRKTRGPDPAEGVNSEGLGSPGVLLTTPLMVRRDAGVVLEWGRGLGLSETREPAVTQPRQEVDGGRAPSDRHRRCEREDVTRCGTARKVRRVLQARRDCHSVMRGHEPDDRPERIRTVSPT